MHQPTEAPTNREAARVHIYTNTLLMLDRERIVHQGVTQEVQV